MSETEPRSITKVKFSKGRVHVEYCTRRPGAEASDEYTVDCGEAPHPSFLAALDSLRGHVLEICEMPSGLKPRTTVHGASFSYTENGDGEEVLGAVITALVTLNRSRSPLVLNTPHKFSDVLNDADDPSFCLSEDAGAAIEEVIDETNKYLDGHRAQGVLPLDDGADSTAHAPPRKTAAATALANNPKFLKAAERLCPDGKDVTALELSISGQPDQKIVLTAESRKRIRARRKALEAAGG